MDHLLSDVEEMPTGRASHHGMVQEVTGRCSALRTSGSPELPARSASFMAEVATVSASSRTPCVALHSLCGQVTQSLTAGVEEDDGTHLVYPSKAPRLCPLMRVGSEETDVPGVL